jgi:hypothetical protein
MAKLLNLYFSMLTAPVLASLLVLIQAGVPGST